MNAESQDQFRSIRFAGELLPDWAQYIDLAAMLCPVPKETRQWFSRFAACPGVDDGRTVFQHCTVMRRYILEQRQLLFTELSRNRADDQPAKIIAAWLYTMDTMIDVSLGRATCAWTLDGVDNLAISDSDDGDITLRRV